MDQRRGHKGKVLRSQFGTAARKKSFMLQAISFLSERLRSAPSASLSALARVGVPRRVALARIVLDLYRVDSWTLAPPARPQF